MMLIHVTLRQETDRGIGQTIVRMCLRVTESSFCGKLSFPFLDVSEWLPNNVKR